MSAAEEIQAEYAAKIETATQAAAARRDSAWISVPFDVCGVMLRPMRLPDYLALIVSENAHVSSRTAPEDEQENATYWAINNAQILWLLSPEFTPGDKKRRDQFVKKVGRLGYDEVMTGLSEYLRETFADSRRGPVKTDKSQSDPLRVSFAALWVHTLASAYGWSRAEIDLLPLKEVFQLLRVLDAEATWKSGKRPKSLVDESDRLWAEMLEKVDALQTAEAKA